MTEPARKRRKRHHQRKEEEAISDVRRTLRNVGQYPAPAELMGSRSLYAIQWRKDTTPKDTLAREIVARFDKICDGKTVYFDITDTVYCIEKIMVPCTGADVVQVEIGVVGNPAFKDTRLLDPRKLIRGGYVFFPIGWMWGHLRRYERAHVFHVLLLGTLPRLGANSAVLRYTQSELHEKYVWSHVKGFLY
jgi:hypothetical protein